MALLRSFGSMHTYQVPLALWRYVNEPTQGRGPPYWVMVSCTVTSLCWVSMFSLASIGPLYLPCWTSRMVGSNVMRYSPGILLILSMQSRNMIFKSLMLWRALWSCNGEIIDVLSWKWHTVDLQSWKRWTGTVVDVVLVENCFLTASRCLHWAALLRHNTLSSPSSVPAIYDMMMSFLVSTMKNHIGISLPVLQRATWWSTFHVMACCPLCKVLI